MRNKAIRNLYSNIVTISNELDCWDSEGNTVVIDESKVQKELEKLQSDYDSKKYQRDRALAFDPIPEQLDQIYHDMDGWKAKIKSVKDKYPKPT